MKQVGIINFLHEGTFCMLKFCGSFSANSADHICLDNDEQRRFFHACRKLDGVDDIKREQKMTICCHFFDRELVSSMAIMAHHLREFSTSRSRSSGSLSEAGFIVMMAAERVENLDPTDILSKMDHEKINEAWQLEYVDALQWQMLGVPVGLVAAIRRCLAEQKATMRESTSIYPTVHSVETMDSSMRCPLRPNIVPPETLEIAAILGSSPQLRSGQTIPAQIVSRSRSSIPPIKPQRRSSNFLEWQGDACDDDQTNNTGGAL